MANSMINRRYWYWRELLLERILDKLLDRSNWWATKERSLFVHDQQFLDG